MPGIRNSGKSITSFFSSNPLVGIASLIVGLSGTAIAVYFGLGANIYPDLVYAVGSSRAIVMQVGQTSDLVCTHRGKSVETDVTAVQVYVWNNGKKAMKKAGILEPLVIHTEDNTPILEAKLRYRTRDVTNLERNDERRQSGEIEVTWDILEKGDGAIFQLIYAGDPSVVISATGIFEGQRAISGGSYRRDQSRASDVLLVLSCLVMSVLFLGVAVSLFREMRRDPSHLLSVGGVLSVLTLLTPAALGVALLFLAGRALLFPVKFSPFGP